MCLLVIDQLLESAFNDVFEWDDRGDHVAWLHGSYFPVNNLVG